MADVRQDRDQAGMELSAADEQLVRELTERARADGLKLTGEGGLLGRLTKMIIEGALEGEMDDHLGNAKHDPAGRNCGNSRNGYRVAVQPESGFHCGHARFPAGLQGALVQQVRMVAGGGPLRCYGGAVAGGSQGPSVNSRVRASRASMPHLAVVDR